MRLDIPSMVTGAGEEQHEPHSSRQHSQSLSDGRLNVGTHLPLMAKRYAYLSLIGEGTSAQVWFLQLAVSEALLLACPLSMMPQAHGILMHNA